MVDYTMEELFEYQKICFDRDDRIKCWGMRLNGVDWYIPYDKLKLGHLKNIIKWVEDHKWNYPQHVLVDMKAEYQSRYEAASPAEKVLFG